MAKNQPQDSPVVIMLMTALDTTWRMFIPIIGGTFAGIGLDTLFGIAPIATILCLTAGVVISSLLIVRQFNTVRKTKN